LFTLQNSPIHSNVENNPNANKKQKLSNDNQHDQENHHLDKNPTNDNDEDESHGEHGIHNNNSSYSRKSSISSHSSSRSELIQDEDGIHPENKEPNNDTTSNPYNVVQDPQHNNSDSDEDSYFYCVLFRSDPAYQCHYTIDIFVTE
jgi:hypothetical protein